MIRKPPGYTNLMHCFVLVILGCFVPESPGAESGKLQVKLRVDLGSDNGQAYGTLWEATDPNGAPMAGAGFLNAYNTQDRSDRRMLQVFIRTGGEETFATELLPRPTTDAGTYLFGFDGQLFSKGRGAIDNKLRVWRQQNGRWEVDKQTIPFSVHVAGKIMSATSQRITYDGRPVLELAPEQGQIGEWYYGAGKLIVRRKHLGPESAINELIALDWTSSDSPPLRIENGVKLALSTPHEFIYAFGQHGKELVAASNMGGVHVVDGENWRTLREPDGKSFQIYSTLSTGNRLLLGQYPTGELFEFAGEKLQRLPGWPPVMKGVSSNAREAQTLALYGGDLYVGVWPWGEVWRQSGVDQRWSFMGRLFTHPEPTDKTTHPYEVETQQRDPVLNRWGQRVTSMVPIGDSLYLATSAKGPNPYESKFAFLSEGKHLEYGAVHRYRKPGCLSVPIEWKSQPTTVEFHISAKRIEVIQDGKLLGATDWDDRHPALLEGLSVRYGSGLFGPYGGAHIEVMKSESVKLPQPFRGTYIHLNKLIPPSSSSAEQEMVLTRESERMKQFGLNALMPFVIASSGDAYYESDLLKRIYSDSDPVQILSRESRSRGIGFYPVVPIAICGNEQPNGVLLQHPEWALRHPDGRAMGYISPAHPEARKWLASVIHEIVVKYQPDGLVLDYIRYPNRPLRLDPASEARFRESIPANCTPEEEKKRLQEFKENELTELVRLISQTGRAAKPNLKIGAYVWGPHVTRDHQIAQVWPLWVEHGYLDMVNVSGYCHRETYGENFLNVFEQRMADSLELNRQLPKPAMLTFALGVNTSHGRVHSADDIRSYLKIADRLKLDGVAYFTWEYLQPYVDQLRK